MADNLTNTPNKNKKVTLTNYIGRSFGWFLVTIVVLLTVLIVLGVVYLMYRNEAMLITLAVLLPTLIVISLLYIFYSYRSMYKIFYSTLYEKTLSNYEALRTQKRTLEKYELDQIEDFDILNDKINLIQRNFDNIQIYSSKTNYDKVPLDYINKSKKTITEKSFKDCIREIIYCAQSYRNAIISLTFEKGADITTTSINDVCNAIHEIFKERGLLIALGESNDTIMIFSPNIDSISYLREQLEALFTKSTISVKTISGIDLISPKINAVIYPYTSIEEIYSDLLYSATKNKDVNIYIPKRYNGSSNESLLQNTMDINNISKILSNVANLHETSIDFNSQIVKAEEVLKEYAAYLNVEEGGIAFFDREKKHVTTRVAFNLNNKEKTSFIPGTQFNSKIIEKLDEVKDMDCTYLFSSRASLNNELGKTLDLYGINSGFFYYIKNLDDTCLGIVYLINKGNKTFEYNSYIKESLLVMSITIGYYLKIGNVHNQLDEMKVRENNVMKLANIASYTIDKTNYEIVDFTDNLKEEMPNIERGVKCYKSLFKYTAPCPECPLITKNKIIKQFSKTFKGEVSYSINTKMSNYIELIVRGIENKDESRNRFDSDLLVYSYYSFVERLKNLYASESKGYIQLLSIDNIKDMIQAYGNEGFAFYIRCFASEVVTKIPQISDIYLYKDDTLAFIFPESGKLDIINVLEKVYEFSKKDYLRDGNDVRLCIGYETVKYPQEFTRPTDLIRHLEKCISERDYNVFKTDYIHIEENDFYRPVSRKEYILSIIEQAHKNNNFIIKCQPVVKGSTKAIFGGEILIRLSDDYANTLLNTEELIRVAGENNKLNTISDLVLNYTANLFTQFGASIFKSYGFERISINADYNYFTQEDFFNKVESIIKTHNMPKNFLAFEISEQNLASNYENFKEVSEQLKKHDVNIICDQYTGEHLSLDKVRQLNIKEIKTQRDFVRDIDVQSEKYENLKKLMDFAKEQGVTVTLLGVENGQQYKLVSSYDKNINMQGYYFHHALDVNELLEAIRKSNN